MTEPLESPKWAGSNWKECLREGAISLLVSALLGLICYWLYILGRGLFNFSDAMPNLILKFGSIVIGVLVMTLTGLFGWGTIGVWFMRMRFHPKPERPPTPTSPLGPTGL